MENSNPTSNDANHPSSWLVVVVIIIAATVGTIVYLLETDEESNSVVVENPTIEEKQPVTEQVVMQTTPEPQEEVIEDIVDVVTIEELPTIEEEPTEPVKEPLPLLNESDAWIKEQLLNLTWRKELLKLVIDDDMIRRLVVFTDNFAQGLIAYEHSPLVKPHMQFQVSDKLPSDDANTQVWLWNNTSSKRFDLYVDLLRSIDVENLVSWYVEVKPLIDEAYTELGYPDDDFTDILLEAITRVLDMEFPKSSLELVRPSVMYQYRDNEVENLPDTEKLLLRIGKENLLVIKSVLLEFSDKLARERNK